MKLKATKKQIKENSGLIISIGYCELQSLLSCLSPFAYSCGINGWSCDYYDIDGTIISTGYAPIGVHVGYQLVKKYEEMAEKVYHNYDVSYDARKAGLNRILRDFINEVKQDIE